jgi:two-component system chemotaxis sensor kinase CheA
LLLKLVKQALDGQEALDILNDNSKKVDLVLTDIEMPVMDGWELTRNIKKSQHLQHLPIIAVTSVSGAEAEAKGKSLGIDEYLIKLDREQIIQTMKQYLYSNQLAMAE